MATTGSAQVIDMQEWRRFGVNVPAALFGMTLVAVHPYALGVMFEPLEREFGWSRAEISAGPLVTSITALLLAAFGGRAVDKYGPRKIALLGVPSFAIALSAIALAGPSIVSWLALYALLAVALILVYPSVWTAAIAQRFEANRGLALAVVLSGTGIASTFVPILGATLIEAYGWRGAYMGLGALAFIIQFPLVYFLFAKDEPPKPTQIQPPPAAKHAGKLGDLASPKFIRLSIAGVIYSLAATGLGINAVPILMEEGFELIAAAKIAGLIGIGTITGRILGGFLLDRIDGRYVAVGCAVGALGSAAIFLATDQSPLAASVACVMLGLTAGAEYDACAYLVSRHFPRNQFATLFAVLGGLFGFTSGVAPFIANSFYEIFGGYDAILWGIIPLFGVSTVMFMSLGRYPDLLAAEATA
ncbi:MFS transporter [Erythrobacter alti]|uniref:MFS transporter n=1 Tax=Erythrobacter alti TaxID=1896145 RepID=UPI0030F3DBEF